MKKARPVVGDVFEIQYPFVREPHTTYEEDGEGSLTADDGERWKPGTRFEDRRDGDHDAKADGMGLQILTVVSLHQPGSYPTRVFYTRKWRDPDGLEFGKRTLRMMSVSGFAYLCQGYRHRFDVVQRVKELV